MLRIFSHLSIWLVCCHFCQEMWSHTAMFNRTLLLTSSTSKKGQTISRVAQNHDFFIRQPVWYRLLKILLSFMPLLKQMFGELHVNTHTFYHATWRWPGREAVVTVEPVREVAIQTGSTSAMYHHKRLQLSYENSTVYWLKNGGRGAVSHNYSFAMSYCKLCTIYSMQ